LKHHVGVTIDSELFREIERIRGREKRSTFVEHLIEDGLRRYKAQNKVPSC
jgi:metal-responsive CopG/Arc/MetJ family transcriptional regulator